MRALKLWIRLLTFDLRKILMYRLTFWIDLAGSLGASLLTVYFLWSTIFKSQGITELRGYTLSSLIAYAVYVPLMDRMSRGQEMGIFDRDIYDGSLTKYLLYPMPVYAMKFTSTAAHLIIGSFQLVVAMLILGRWNFGFYLQGLGAVILASLLYYTLVILIESVAFWQDNVWSLMVLLKLLGQIFGGAMVPLALFPDGARAWLEILPFAQMTSFPVRAVLGELSAEAWFHSAWISLAWTCGIFVLANAVFHRGLKRYSGVGI